MSKSDTYGVSVVSVLELCLVQLRLLLYYDRLDLGVFRANDLQEIFSEHLGASDHGFIWTSITTSTEGQHIVDTMMRINTNVT